MDRGASHTAAAPVYMTHIYLWFSSFTVKDSSEIASSGEGGGDITCTAWTEISAEIILEVCWLPVMVSSRAIKGKAIAVGGGLVVVAEIVSGG